MNSSIEILRLDIEGQWSVNEFGHALTCLSDLYDIRFVLEAVWEDQKEWARFNQELMKSTDQGRRWKRGLHYLGTVVPVAAFPSLPPGVLEPSEFSRLCRLLDPHERLEVRRISYGSPGVSDLAGIGVIVGHLKDFVVSLIELRASRRSRSLENERAELENDHLRLKNAREFVALGRDLGYTATDLRRLVAHVDEKQEVLLRLVDQRKLTGATIGDSESKQS